MQLAILLMLMLIPVAAQADTLSTARIVEYIGEGVDCVNSARIDRLYGGYETNFTEKLFSHGGIPTYCAGPALGDLIGGMLIRRWPKNIKIGLAYGQAASNVYGINFTFTHIGK